jgi:hypothetical protein
VKGGGQPFAALSVGSRAVGKRKTLYDMETANRIFQAKRSRFLHALFRDLLTSSGDWDRHLPPMR